MHREEIIDPRIAAHGGRIVNTTGDGLLVEFPSVVDAVKCAVDVQTELDGRDTDVAEDRRIQYRIGINLGDIVIDGDDILGDGVNIAARLEGLAEPGGICIAGDVFNQVRGKLDLTFNLLGEREVKNIAHPVSVYQVLVDNKASRLASRVQQAKSVDVRWYALSGWHAYLAVAILLAFVSGGALWWNFHISGPATSKVTPASTKGALAPALLRPSIAVLPYANLSDDKEQEYFSDGLTEDLITDLSRVSGLTVISRTSTFAYKGQSADVRTVGKELGVRYVVQGSVRKLRGRVRISTQLVDADSGNYLWAGRFDRAIADLFDLQDEVRGKIVQALKVKLSAREKKWLARHPTESPQAYDLYLRGLRQESYYTREGNLESRRLFQRAIELDPSFALAYAHLGQAYSLAQEYGWTEKREEFADKALALAKKAIELDEELPQAHWALGRIYTRQPFRDHETQHQTAQTSCRVRPKLCRWLRVSCVHARSDGKSQRSSWWH